MGFRKLANDELGRIDPDTYREVEKLPVVVVLDNIRSQHNIGAVFRTSDAFRIGKLYLCGITATPPHREIHKSALGAEDSVPWEYHEETLDVVRQLQAEGYVIVSVEQAENSLSLEGYALEKGHRYAFVFGNEVRGVQQEVVDASDYCLEIPQFGTKHSLNISVSAGIVLWQIASPLFTGIR